MAAGKKWEKEEKGEDRKKAELNLQKRSQGIRYYKHYAGAAEANKSRLGQLTGSFS